MPRLEWKRKKISVHKNSDLTSGNIYPTIIQNNLVALS